MGEGKPKYFRTNADPIPSASFRTAVNFAHSCTSSEKRTLTPLLSRPLTIHAELRTLRWETSLWARLIASASEPGNHHQGYRGYVAHNNVLRGTNSDLETQGVRSR